MEQIQRNGGTAGLIAAACLLLLFILFASSGMDMQAMMDPGKALPAMGQKSGLFATIGLLGLLAAGFGIIFTFGIWARLREKSPTRAVATLGFAFVGLVCHAAASGLLWQGGGILAALYGKDQTTAGHAWAALGAVTQGLMATANAFTGSAVLVAGWAIVDTKVMNATLGWVAVVAGIIQILQVFSSSMPLMGLGFLGAIIWLAWGGSQLRRSPA